MSVLPPARLGLKLPFVVLAAAALGGASARASQVRGRIDGQETLTPAVFVEAARPDAHRFTWREPSPTVRAEFRALTANPSRELCIAALTTGSAPAHDPVAVRITGGRTLPATLVTGAGWRLAFENRDPFPHRLYVVGRQDWKAETIEPKSSRQWTPPGPGRYEIRDELFPSVRTYVVVDAQVVSSVYPGRDGAFAFPDLPAGELTLRAYFDGRPVGRPLSVVSKERGLIELRDPLSVVDSAAGKPAP